MGKSDIFPLNEPELDEAIERALNFIDSLRVDDARFEYEVAEQNHSERKVYNQSQYLLSAMFELLGKEDLAQRIHTHVNVSTLRNLCTDLSITLVSRNALRLPP